MDYETFQSRSGNRRAWVLASVGLLIVGALVIAARISGPVSPPDPVLAKILDACPGLQRYRQDWFLQAMDPAKGTAEIVINDPVKAMPYDYYATGHHCYFETGGARTERVAVWKRPCVSACLGERSQVPDSTLIEIR